MNRGFVFLSFLLFFSCATYYQKNRKFNEYFQSGQMEAAYKQLSGDNKKHRKDKLILLLNKGVTASMLGKYEESNQFFEEAYYIADDLQKNYVNEGLALLTNPNMVPYKGEDFEILFIHYYKALNYLKLNEREKALVECKRMNIELNQLQDKYKSDKRYKEDAFMHLLMGLIYDVNDDYNNAFIAYRNSLNIYESDYSVTFGLSAPDQLKKDILRTAYLSGLNEELLFFEKKFGTKYAKTGKSEGEVVFIWQNGLGPVKSEWSIDFAIVRGQGGNLFFVNDQLNLNFHFQMNDDNYKSSGLADLKIIRIAFPKYIERPPVYNSAKIIFNGSNIPLEKVEDINQIAFKSLNDRMHLELGKSLLRFALKKAAEVKVSKENGSVGAALGILNAITEKADTRNWQTVPHDIYYARIPVEKGRQELTLSAASSSGHQRDIPFTFEISSGQTVFLTFHSIESMGF